MQHHAVIVNTSEVVALVARGGTVQRALRSGCKLRSLVSALAAVAAAAVASTAAQLFAYSIVSQR